MISASMVKIAALGGIALVWWELTCETIKLGQKIIFSSWQCKEDVCESCGQHIDDEELDDEELDVRYGDEEKCENPLCKICI